MKIKKMFAMFLTIALMSIFTTPLSMSVSANTNEETLYDFLQTTDKVTATFQYPSMKIAAASSNKSVLTAHTPIVIRCEETITTRDVVSGGTVNFSVLNDVKGNNGLTLVKAGTPVTAQITFAKSKDLIGRSGELTINDFHTTAIDGTYIPLSGSMSAKPDDKLTKSIVLSVLICPLFLLMKGDEARLEAGAQKTAYTITDTYIKSVRL